MDEAPAAIAGVGVIVTGLLGYLTGKRRNSGSVATTDADKLWAQVDTHLKRLDRLIAEQGETISNLKFELHQKDEKIATLEASDVRKTAQIIDLQNELERVKDRERRVAETLADKEERAAG
ncbi:MAG: hypothetical protein ACSLFM_07870 [Tepidiformaceae bacterium]